MRRVVRILVLLAFVLPVMAYADGISLVDQYGTVTITTAGITSTGNDLVQFNSINAPKDNSLGQVSFSTGALISGSIWTGGTFSSAGSIFEIIGRGAYGQPKGVIFNGHFIGPVDWTLVASNKLFHEYDLSGTIQGELWTGRYVSGTTTQTIYTYWNQEKVDHKGDIYLGKTHLTTPEPSTLGLLGIGLFAIGGVLRRKIVAS